MSWPENLWFLSRLRDLSETFPGSVEGPPSHMEHLEGCRETDTLVQFYGGLHEPRETEQVAQTLN